MKALWPGANTRERRLCYRLYSAVLVDALAGNCPGLRRLTGSDTLPKEGGMQDARRMGSIPTRRAVAWWPV
jgi:hypothetical protein